MTTPRVVKRYIVGDLIHAPATFVTTDGITAADPSTIIFLWKNPLGSVACYMYGQSGASVMRTAVGAYFKEFTADAVGSGFYRWHATGGIQSAEEWSYFVDRSNIL